MSPKQTFWGSAEESYVYYINIKKQIYNHTNDFEDIQVQEEQKPNFKAKPKRVGNLSPSIYYVGK